MRIFVSSVTAGLEEERRALPGFIRALGHEPVRFEDFGAQTVPSREACLDSVASSDVYVLLLGPHYGYQFPETGQSATHDESVEALSKGIRTLVFPKDGVERDPDQAKFVAKVGDYSAGWFWDSYTDTPDLLTRFAAAIRSLENAPSPLTYEVLGTDLAVSWKGDWEQRQDSGWSDSEPTYIETHVTPLDGPPWTVRQLRQLPDALISSMRNVNAVPMAAGVEPAVTDEHVVITVPDESRRAHDEHTPARLQGLRVARTGQVSAWSTAPRAMMGAHLTVDSLTSVITDHLRLAGALNILNGDRFAVSVGVGGSMIISTGANTGGLFGTGGVSSVRISPDESVSDAAFGVGAVEVATNAARRLLTASTS